MTAVPPRLAAARQHPAAVAVLALVVAVAARLLAVQRSPGGFGGERNYDPGVYFAAADALIHGRVPYSGFTLLHPPGLMLALTPFAALARVIGDRDAYVLANTAFAVVGAVTAALVPGVARRYGASPGGAFAGGAVAALWLGSVLVETATRLETLANLLLVLALRAFASTSPRRASLAGGALLGLLVTVKIWWVAPAVAALLWQARRHGPRRGLAAAVAAAVAGLAAVLPFLVAAPSALWRSVVADQIGRPGGKDRVSRWAHVLTGNYGGLHGHRTATLALAAAGGLVAVAAVVVAWRGRRGRPFVGLLLTHVAVLALSPVYFAHYADLLTVPLALVVAFAVTAAPGRRRFGQPATAAVLLTTAVTVAAIGFGHPPVSTPFPSDAVARAVAARPRCVVSDSPGALALMGVLSRGLANGCPQWVDVTGRVYGPDAFHGRNRIHDPLWQRDATRYFRSGDAVILARGGTGMTPANLRLILSGPVLARFGRFALHATRTGATTAAARGTVVP